MCIIAGRSLKILSKKFAKHTGINLLNVEIGNFADGEIRVKILENVDDSVIIIQSTLSNNHIIELLLLIDSAKRANAKNILLIIPYFGYSRQESPRDGEPLSIELIAKLLKIAGANSIITLDIHSEKSIKFFDIPIYNLSNQILFDSIKKIDDIDLVVAPDFGAIIRAKNLATLWGIDYICIKKNRINHNKCTMHDISQPVFGKNCIIVDDILDTAGTLCSAVDLLKKNGAKKIYALVTHALLSGTAIDKIMNSNLNMIFVSDSVYHEKLPDKFKILQIDYLLANFLKNIKLVP